MIEYIAVLLAFAAGFLTRELIKSQKLIKEYKAKEDKKKNDG